MNINEKLIRISGKTPIGPGKELKLGDDVIVRIKGGIVKIESLDNQDGTYNQVYVVKPLEVEVL